MHILNYFGILNLKIFVAFKINCGMLKNANNTEPLENKTFNSVLLLRILDSLKILN